MDKLLSWLQLVWKAVFYSSSLAGVIDENYHLKAENAKLIQQIPPELPEPEIGILPPYLVAKPIYEHWHPGGRSLFGFLIITRNGHEVQGFVPYACPAYGIESAASSLEKCIGNTGIEVREVGKYKHCKTGGRYWLVGEATVQCSTGPLQDNEKLLIYEGRYGDFYIRRPSEFFDGRFEPLNGLAKSQSDKKQI